MSKLKTAYTAAVSKLGGDLPLALLRAFGGIEGPDDVPAERVNGLVAALSRITNGGQISAAMAARAAHGDRSPAMKAEADDGESIFAGIRAKAYGENAEDDDRPKSLAALHEQAYLKGNRKRQKID